MTTLKFLTMDHKKLWNILKEMGRWDYQTTLPASWEIWMQNKQQ